MNPLALAPASHDADCIINVILLSLGQGDQYEIQHDFSGHMIPMLPSMPCDTDTKTGTNTGRKSQMIPLNNHLNMTNAIVSLMTPSASGDRKHVIAIYMPKLLCPSNATYKQHMPISSCAHMRQQCHYICIICAHCNQLCGQEDWYAYISYYWHIPLNN